MHRPRVVGVELLEQAQLVFADLRGLFEFNLNGKQLDEYVKKQVNDYREQAKAFGLAK